MAQRERLVGEALKFSVSAVNSPTAPAQTRPVVKAAGLAASTIKTSPTQDRETHALRQTSPATSPATATRAATRSAKLYRSHPTSAALATTLHDSTPAVARTQLQPDTPARTRDSRDNDRCACGKRRRCFP